MDESQMERNSSWDFSEQDPMGSVPVFHASLYASSSCADHFLGDPSSPFDDDKGTRLQIPGQWGGQAVVTPNRVHTAPAVTSSSPQDDVPSVFNKTSAEFEHMPATAAIWQDDVRWEADEPSDSECFVYRCEDRPSGPEAPPIFDPRMALDRENPDFVSSYIRPDGPEIRPVSDAAGLGFADQRHARPSGRESRPVSDAAAAGLDSGSWWREIPEHDPDSQAFEHGFSISANSASPAPFMDSGEDYAFEEHQIGMPVPSARSISPEPALASSLFNGDLPIALGAPSSARVWLASQSPGTKGLAVKSCEVECRLETPASVKKTCGASLMRATQEPWRDTGYHICGPRCRRCSQDPTAMSPPRVRLPPVSKNGVPPCVSSEFSPVQIQKRTALNNLERPLDSPKPLTSNGVGTPMSRHLEPRDVPGQGQCAVLGQAVGSTVPPTLRGGQPCTPILGRERFEQLGRQLEPLDPPQNACSNSDFWPADCTVDRGAGELRAPRSSSRRPMRGGCRNPRRTRLLKMALQSGDLAKTWGNNPCLKNVRDSHQQDAASASMPHHPARAQLLNGGESELPLPPVTRIRGQKKPIKLQSLLTAAWDVKS